MIDTKTHLLHIIWFQQQKYTYKYSIDKLYLYLLLIYESWGMTVSENTRTNKHTKSKGGITLLKTQRRDE